MDAIKVHKHYEDYAKKYLNIPNVNFEGLDPLVINEMLEALIYAYKKYPELRNVFCSIGNFEDLKAHFSLAENYYEEMVTESESDMFIIWSLLNRKTHNNFIGLSYSKNLVGKTLKEVDEVTCNDAKRGLHPQSCTTFKSSVYHEIGHIFDFILRLRKDPNFLKIIHEKYPYESMYTEFSRYSITLEEFIAEVFAEYMMNPNSDEFVNKVGKYIDRKYEILKGMGIFNINEIYWRHIRRAEFESTYARSK